MQETPYVLDEDTMLSQRVLEEIRRILITE